MLPIQKNITTRNKEVMNNRNIQYIVIHYVGAVSSAYNNTVYFKNTYREASAHYFVDDSSIWQCVEDKDKAWHCGGGLQGSSGHSFYQKCTNTNSIGIEMCCFMNNGKLDISEQTINNTIELVKHLMNKYGVSADRVIRHYDVTGKNCPAPFVANESRWTSFKNKLGTSNTPTDVANGVSVLQIQQGYNTIWGSILGRIAEDDSAGPDTRKHLVMALQHEMNKQYNSKLAVDGSFGPATRRAFLDLKQGVSGNITWLCQAMLYIKGYNPNGLDKSYGPGMANTVLQYQNDNGLKTDKVLGMNTAYKLFN